MLEYLYYVMTVLITIGGCELVGLEGYEFVGRCFLLRIIAAAYVVGEKFIVADWDGDRWLGCDENFIPVREDGRWLGCDDGRCRLGCKDGRRLGLVVVGFTIGAGDGSNTTKIGDDVTGDAGNVTPIGGDVTGTYVFADGVMITSGIGLLGDNVSVIDLACCRRCRT